MFCFSNKISIVAVVGITALYPAGNLPSISLDIKFRSLKSTRIWLLPTLTFASLSPCNILISSRIAFLGTIQLILLICFLSRCFELIASLCASVATAVRLFGVISSNNPHSINLTSGFDAIEKLVLLSKSSSCVWLIVNVSRNLASSNVGKLFAGKVESLKELLFVFKISLFLDVVI